MKRFYDSNAMLRDVTAALEGALEKHGVDSLFHPLAICMVLEAIASPMKASIVATPLMKEVGTAGVDLYVASRLAQKIELLKSPDSVVVNPMMDAIAAALRFRKDGIDDEDLFLNTLRVFLKKPRLSQRGIDRELALDSSLDAAFQSAKSYLVEGEVIHRDAVSGRWAVTL